MFYCTDCNTNLFSQSSLNRHKLTSKHCSEYKDVLFLCTKCNTTLKGIENIDFHVELCDGETPNNDTSQTPSLSVKDIHEYQTKLRTLQEENSKLKNIEKQLFVEKIKNEYCRRILLQKLGLDFSNIFEENEDGYHFYNPKNIQTDVTVHLHDYIKNNSNVVTHNTLILESSEPQKSSSINTDEKEFVISITPPLSPKKAITQTSKTNEVSSTNNNSSVNNSSVNNSSVENPKKVTRNKKLIFRPVKNMDLDIEETKEERNTRIQLIEAELQTKIQKSIKLADDDTTNIEDTNIEDTKLNLQKYTDQLQTDTAYDDLLYKMRRNRFSLLYRIPLHQYIAILNKQVENVTQILKKKHVTNKRIRTLLLKYLSPIEQRLIFFEDYHRSFLEIDDIESFGISLTLSANFPKEFVPFDDTQFYSNFYNYNVALFPLQDTIKKFLFNRYDFYNIIYLKLPKTGKRDVDSDPFSFYILKDIVKDKRCWKIDYRMEDFSISFVHNLKPFIKNTFRKMYCDVFSDNTYRKDYKTNSQITQCEFTQLLRNYVTISDPILFSKIIKDLVIENAEYTPTPLDTINLKTDDALQKKRLQSYKYEQADIINDIKDLFDDLPNEDAIILFNEYFTFF
jgi:hypothetical protein